MLSDKFSILTATYNGGDFIDTWSASIVAQTYRPLEVILTDDCSTDKTFKKIKSIKKFFCDNNIDFRFLRNKVQVHYGWNLKRAAKRATGNYMGILDIDDALYPHAITHVMSLFEKYPKLGHIYTQFETCDADFNPIKRGHSSVPDRKQNILSMLAKYDKRVYSHFKAFKRHEKLDWAFKNLRCCVDQWIGVSMEELYPGGFTDVVCYKYRENIKGSISDIHGSHRRHFMAKLIARLKKRRLLQVKKVYPIIKLDS